MKKPFFGLKKTVPIMITMQSVAPSIIMMFSTITAKELCSYNLILGFYLIKRILAPEAAWKVEV